MGTRGSGVFVGREREFAGVVQRLDLAGAGQGATVLVTGDAGIGKTRLAAEVAAAASAKGFEVLLGRSIDLVGVELPFQPFVDALRPLGNPFRDEVRGSQLQVFESVLALLSERAAINPLLVVLEDLHWADVSTLDLVVFLAHNVVDVPVVLVATCRSAEPGSGTRGPADGWCAPLRGSARRRIGAAGRCRSASAARRPHRRRSGSGRARRHRRPGGGQPVLRRGAARSQRIGGSAATWCAGPVAAPLHPARPVDPRRAPVGRDGRR